MEKIHKQSILLILLIAASFDIHQYLVSSVIAADIETPLDKCSCEMKDALKKGEWEKAYKSAEDIVTMSPMAPEAGDAYLWLGLYHKSYYDYPKSSAYYQKAADTFPGTWVSAEATARLGCNQFKMNNYKKALEYFNKAGSEAKSWQQRKYASTWSKWVGFAVRGQEKEVAANCATKSIDYYINTKGMKYDKDKLKSSLTFKDGLIPLSNILESLTNEKIEIKSVKCPLKELSRLQLPVLAAVKPSHMIVIKSVEKDDNGRKINVYDPVLGEIAYYEKELSPLWTETVLTVPGSAEKKNWIASFLENLFGRKFAAVDKKEIDNIFLGSCFCCPQDFPINDCDSDASDGDCPCNRVPPPPPGPPGGCGSCIGTSGFGFPSITVDTSSLSLIVRDTPIGYVTGLGDDVRVSMTFNSDLSSSGVFGNGWHSNLDCRIEENVGVSVTVTRSGGHSDTYPYLGGSYISPMGATNTRLVKLQDGSFVLEFLKSHKKWWFASMAYGGRITATENGSRLGGLGTGYVWDINGHIFCIVIDDNYTFVDTDNAGRIVGVTDPLGRQASFTYDGAGNLVQVQDMAGNTFTYAYDVNNNITSLTEPKGIYTITYDMSEDGSEIWVSSIKNPANHTYYYGQEYPTQVIDPKWRTTYYYADWWSKWPNWPWYGDTLQVTDALGNSISYTYDDYRNKTAIKDKNGNTTTYAYNASRGVISKTDPMGNIWSYTYDSNNNLSSAVDPTGKSTIYQYDADNHLLSVTEKDPSQTILSVVSYTYDYDIATGVKDSMTVNGKTTYYYYDEDYNVCAIMDPEGNETQFTYDIIGRKKSVISPNNARTQYQYDNLDRVTKIINPDLTFTEFAYDCCGLSRKTDENGKITLYEYNALAKLTKVTDPEGNETVYTYDEVGNLASIKDAKNNITNYEYDQLDRLVKTTYPSGRKETYTYDNVGNMLTKTDGKGVTTRYTYDKNDRLTKIEVLE